MSTRLLRLLALGWILAAVLAPVARAAAATPPRPAAHFNDYANYVPADRARALDARLAQFERDTSSPLVVAIYPRLPDGAALEDYTVRAAQAWGVGRKDRDNGAVLFVFVADRALRIEVGYGLEGTLTDAVAHAIIENELKPNLRAGNPAAAMDAAVNAMIAATKGEYRGTGRTLAEGRPANGPAGRSSGGSPFVILVWLFIIVSLLVSWFRNGFTFQNPGRRGGSGGSWGGWSGGGGSSGGGGGFSGGGGSFGGGGASGKW